jgi:hypothetical protein
MQYGFHVECALNEIMHNLGEVFLICGSYFYLLMHSDNLRIFPNYTITTVLS